MAAFIPGGVTAAAVGGRRRPALCTSRGATAARTRVETRCLVVDVGSAEQLQVVIDSASEANALVVIDYSTTWCGPCKVRVARLVLVAARVPHPVGLGFFLSTCRGCRNEPVQLPVLCVGGIPSVPRMHGGR